MQLATQRCAKRCDTASRPSTSIAIAFYLWVGIFNLMVPAQFWAFANDIYSPEAGKRLFVIVAFGASAGAVFGSFLAGKLVEPLGAYQLLLVSGAILLASLALTNLVDSREARPEGARATASAPEKPLGKGGAFRQVLFLPTTREQKYKAKQAIDTFFVRSGDALSALLVFFVTTMLALSTQQFVMINILLVCTWLLLAFMIGREHRELVPNDTSTEGRSADSAA